MPSIKKIRRMAFNRLFHHMAQRAEINPHIVKAKQKTEVFKDIHYRASGLKEHRLDIYKPSEHKGPYPILIYIHGGGFTMCSKETHRSCGYLYASFGYLVFNLNYRLAPKHKFPAALEDVCHAYKWVVENAHHYNGDLSRLSLAGESAGGNLVLGLMVASCWERPEPYAKLVWDTKVTPAAVQCIESLLQVSSPERFKQTKRHTRLWLGNFSTTILHDLAVAYLGSKNLQYDETRALADPLVIIESDQKPDRPLPPIYLPVGTSDPVLTDTIRMEKALQARKTEVEAKYYPNEPHAFHFMPWNKTKRKFWQDSKAFMDRHLMQKN